MSSFKHLFRKSFKILVNKRNNSFLNNFNRFSNEVKPKKWKVLGLNHIAMATNNVNKGSLLFKDVLNLSTSGLEALPEHGVNTIFVELKNTKLEILDPIGESKSPIWSFLQKNPNGGIHHICLEVDDIYAAIDDLKSRGIRVLSDSPKTGAHGKPVVFLHPKDCNGVLIELEQK